MTRIFCDSSTLEACYVIEGQEPCVLPYAQKKTSNEGEYEAVILALTVALGLKEVSPEVFTDSQLVVKQVNGEWKVKKKHLMPLKRRVLALKVLTQATIKWIPREQNPAGRVLE